MLFVLFFIQNDDFHLAIAAFLLGIDKAQFQKWLCFRKIVAHREIVIGNLNLQQVRVCVTVNACVGLHEKLNISTLCRQLWQRKHSQSIFMRKYSTLSLRVLTKL
jgi:hypothetical protein